MQGTGFVVMAVYRPDPTLLARQLSSLRAQTLRDWRCLVGIDGADPDTVTLLKELVDGDERFDVVEYADNLGVYRHFERLLTAVPSDVAWVSLADQDDYWYPEKLAHLVPRLGVPGVTAVFGQARLVDAAGREIGITDRRSGSARELLLRNQLTGCFTVLRPEVVAAALPFPVGGDIAIHDHWLAVCAALDGRVVGLEYVLQDYVQHDANVLGEPRQPSLRDSVTAARRAGGMTAHFLRVVRHRWAWRVAMARVVLARNSSAPAQVTFLPIARGRLGAGVARAVVSSYRAHRISARDALGFLAAAAAWPFVGGGPIERRYR